MRIEEDTVAILDRIKVGFPNEIWKEQIPEVRKSWPGVSGSNRLQTSDALYVWFEKRAEEHRST